MHTKKLLALLVVLIIGSTLLFASGQGESKQADQGKPLTVWMKKGFVEEQNVAFEKRVREFAKMKGIPVNVELLAYEEIFPRWTAAVESGDVPDISFFGYQEVGQFSKQGVLADVTALVKDIQSEYGSIFPNSIDAVTFGNTTYAVPFWGEGTALYYRKDLFQQAGLSGPPNTWQEFQQDAVKLTQADKGVFGAGMGYGQGNSDAEWLSRSIMWAFGGSIFDKNGKLAFDTPQTRDAIAYIVGLFKDAKVTPPTALGWNDGGNNSSYISGQSAMVVNTGSIIKALQNNSPDLLKQTGVVALPAGPAGRFTAGISNNLAIFKNAPNPEIARELMKYLMDPDWYSQWISVSAPLALPVYESLAKTDLWQQEHNKAFMDSMATFKFLGYRGDYTSAAGEIYNMRLINAMFEDIIGNNVSIDKAVANFVSEAQGVTQ